MALAVIGDQRPFNIKRDRALLVRINGRESAAASHADPYRPAGPADKHLRKNSWYAPN